MDSQLNITQSTSTDEGLKLIILNINQTPGITSLYTFISRQYGMTLTLKWPTYEYYAP